MSRFQACPLSRFCVEVREKFSHLQHILARFPPRSLAFSMITGDQLNPGQHFAGNAPWIQPVARRPRHQVPQPVRPEPDAAPGEPAPARLWGRRARQRPRGPTHHAHQHRAKVCTARGHLITCIDSMNMSSACMEWNPSKQARNTPCSYSRPRSQDQPPGEALLVPPRQHGPRPLALRHLHRDALRPRHPAHAPAPAHDRGRRPLDRERGPGARGRPALALASPKAERAPQRDLSLGPERRVRHLHARPTEP